MKDVVTIKWVRMGNGNYRRERFVIIHSGAEDPEMLKALRLYALPDGRLFRPMRCKPTDSELNDHPFELSLVRGNTGKVCFAGKREAQGFADLMESLGRDLVEPIYCERGHWHVRNVEKRNRNMGAMKA